MQVSGVHIAGEQGNSGLFPEQSVFASGMELQGCHVSCSKKTLDTHMHMFYIYIYTHYLCECSCAFMDENVDIPVQNMTHTHLCAYDISNVYTYAFAYPKQESFVSVEMPHPGPSLWVPSGQRF